MESLQYAAQLLAGDLQGGVGEHFNVWHVGPMRQKKAALGVHDMLVICQVELDCSLAAERGNIGNARRAVGGQSELRPVRVTRLEGCLDHR